MVSTKGPKVVEFIEYNIISRFKILARIISKNSPNFKNKDMQRFYYKYKIKHIFCTPYYPQGNEQVEAKNKTIIFIKKKTINISHIDWHTQIPLALWAYITNIRITTRTTLFLLIYVVEVAMPLELEILYLRI